MMKRLAIAGLLLAMTSIGVSAQVNAGEQKSDPNLPFTVTEITTLSLPWTEGTRQKGAISPRNARPTHQKRSAGPM